MILNGLCFVNQRLYLVKNLQRVEALLFIMTLCLLVYSVHEYKIRQALAGQDKKVPDQKGKPTARPTARWGFQLFAGIQLLKFPDGKKAVINLNETHRTVLGFLMPQYSDYYS